MTEKFTDEEIEALIEWLEGFPYEKEAAIVRQLLEERQLRERLEPCRHEDIQKAGTDWWWCRQCYTYIGIVALDGQEGAA